MIVNVYSMRDAKVGYLSPTFELNDAIAIRNFKFALSDSKTVIGANVGDFDLYRIGSFDTDTGRILGCEPPEFVYHGTEA